MQRRFITLLLAVVVMAPILNLACRAQARQIQPGQSEESAKREAWRESMKRTPVPNKGCFNASYPNAKWQEVTCTVAPDVPLLPARRAHSDTVGDTIDDTAYATSGLLSSAEGSFLIVSGLTSASSYSMQVNSNPFSTSACNGAANPAACSGWQQFVFESSGSVYMEYWLINYATTCPSGWTPFTTYGPIYCWMNSSATGVPGWAISSSFPYISLTGNATGGTDTAIVGLDGNLSAVGQDTVLNLEQSWSSAEFNIFGDGNGDQVSFNSGSTFVVQTSINNGTTNAPTCGSVSYTAETNNLNLVTPCCPYGGTSPSIQFMESNASGATATCGANGLQGNFTATPYVTDVNVTVHGGPPFTIDYSGVLEDSTPGATIYYQPTVCGELEGFDYGTAPVYLYYQVENCSGVYGSIWATAPGYLTSPTGSFNL
jgi:hypothetical protein